MTVIASASPSASVMVVEVVGATDSGPTSGQCGSTSDAVAGLGEHRPGMAGDGDDRNLRVLEMVDDRLELGRLAALRDEDRDVALGRHAEIAVDRFGEMEEHRRRAGRGEGRRDLARRHGPICRGR